MIEQQGRVVGSQGSQVLVRMGPGSGCPACDSGRGCGAGVFGRLLRRRPVELNLENRVGARAGDVVHVGISEHLFLRLVNRLYLLPLLSGLAGAAFGHYLGVRVFEPGLMVDLVALAGGLAGVVIALPRSGRAPERLVRGAVRLLDVAQGAARAECANAAVQDGRGPDSQ